MEGAWEDGPYSIIDDTYTQTLFACYVEKNPQYAPAQEEEIEGLRSQIKSLTRSLLRRPYRPWKLRQRSVALLRLGIVDQAAGDAYDSLILVQQAASPSWKHANVIKEEMRKRYHHGELEITELEFLRLAHQLKNKAILTLAATAFFSNSFEECLKILGGRNDKHAQELREAAEIGLREEKQYLKRRGYSREEIELCVRTGTILFKAYPWSKGDLFRRTPEVMRPLQFQLVEQSLHQCMLKPSKMIGAVGQRSGSRIDPQDVWGIVAVRNIEKGTEIFTDCTAFSSCSDSTRCCGCAGNITVRIFKRGRCSRGFCSLQCGRTTGDHWHGSADCVGLSAVESLLHPVNGNTFNFSSDASREWEKEEMAQADLLQKCVVAAVRHSQTTNQHPLTCPILNSLTIAHKTTNPVLFSLRREIIWPRIMLQHLEVDVFASKNFDAWVIQMLQARLRNNTWSKSDGKVQILSINALYAHLNHSCRPNVEVEHLKDGKGEDTTTIRLRALRPIREGEELFVSYLKYDDLKITWPERQEKLGDWFPKCLCERCQWEEKEEQEMRRKPLWATVPRTNNAPGTSDQTPINIDDAPDEVEMLTFADNLNDSDYYENENSEFESGDETIPMSPRKKRRIV